MDILNNRLSPSQSIVIRAADPRDFEAICALNEAEAQHTSAMDVARLTALSTISCYHKVGSLDGIVSAFLLAMCHNSHYANDNFEWFSHVSFTLTALSFHVLREAGA